MGQQQLLLIILGSVIVGIAITVGFSMFTSQSSATNRDEIANEMVHFASVAQGYYRRPRVLGGGGGSFNGLSMMFLTRHTPNLNGAYTMSPDPVSGSPAFFTLTGVGTELGNNGTDNVRVVMQVYADSIKVEASSGN